MGFILMHKEFLIMLAGAIFNEFIANNESIKSNSVGQLLVNWVKSLLPQKQ